MRPMTRCFAPTSATNFRSMHPHSVRFPSVGLSPPPTDPARRSSLFRCHFAARPAPRLLAEVRPQVDARLTTPIELRARCSRLFARGQTAEHRSGRCSRAVAFSTACTVELRTPLTPSVAPRVGEPTRGARTVGSNPSSKSSDSSRFRVPSIDECPFELAFARLESDPPPIPRLCRRGPASDACLLDDARACLELDLFRLARFPPPEPNRPRAIHRLLQSNRFASNGRGRSRTPRTTPAVARRRSSGRGWLRHWERCLAATSRAAANRVFTGQGSEWRRNRLSTRRLSTRSLAKRASPRPARLGHLVSQSRGGSGWSFPNHTEAPLPVPRTRPSRRKCATLAARSAREDSVAALLS
jgi:hypothetical protein